MPFERTLRFVYKIYLLFFRKSFAKAVSITLISGGIAWLSPSVVVWLMENLAYTLLDKHVGFDALLNSGQTSQAGGWTLIALGLGIFIYDQWFQWSSFEGSLQEKYRRIRSLTFLAFGYSIIVAAFFHASNVYDEERRLKHLAMERAKFDRALEEVERNRDLVLDGAASGLSIDQFTLALKPREVVTFLNEHSELMDREHISAMEIAFQNIQLGLDDLGWCTFADPTLQARRLIYGGYTYIQKLLEVNRDAIDGIDSSDGIPFLLDVLQDETKHDPRTLYGDIATGCAAARYSPLYAHMDATVRLQDDYIYFDIKGPDGAQESDIALKMYALTFVIKHTNYDLVTPYGHAYVNQCYESSPMSGYRVSMRCNDTYKLEKIPPDRPGETVYLATLFILENTQRGECAYYLMDMEKKNISLEGSLAQVNSDWLLEQIWKGTAHGYGKSVSGNGLADRIPSPRYGNETLDQFKSRAVTPCHYKFSDMI